MDQKSFELLAKKRQTKVTLSGWKMNSPPKFKLCLMDTSSILTFWNALKMKL